MRLFCPGLIENPREGPSLFCMGVVVPSVIPRRDSSVERLDYPVERVGGRVAAILDRLDGSSRSKILRPRPCVQDPHSRVPALEILHSRGRRLRSSEPLALGMAASFASASLRDLDLAITTRGARQKRVVASSIVLPRASARRRPFLRPFETNSSRTPAASTSSRPESLRYDACARPRLRLSWKPFGERPFRPRPERASHPHRLFCSNERRLGRWKPVHSSRTAK
jgi:hypothetical protein